MTPSANFVFLKNVSIHIYAIPHILKHFISPDCLYLLVLLPHYLTLQKRLNCVLNRNILGNTFFAWLILTKTDGFWLNIIEAVFLLCLGWSVSVLQAMKISSLFKVSITFPIYSIYIYSNKTKLGVLKNEVCQYSLEKSLVHKWSNLDHLASNFPQKIFFMLSWHVLCECSLHSEPLLAFFVRAWDWLSLFYMRCQMGETTSYILTLSTAEFNMTF